MEPAQTFNFNVNDLFNWFKRGELVLNPKFQRRRVWVDKAKSYLIDTIIRQLPIPKLYMRQRIDLATRKSIREIVDGQQRLASVFDYLEGAFPIMPSHNEDFGNRYFNDLPEEKQKQLLGYVFSVDALTGASDAEVLDVFSRINSYTVSLNHQEKLNAEFSGGFKKCVYKLGFEHYKFWTRNKILTDLKIARMLEAQLVSELIFAMLEGLQSGDKRKLKAIYKKYEDTFPQENEVTERFRKVMDIIGNIFPAGLSSTGYRRVPQFYSLFTAIYDALYGLSGSSLKRLRIVPECYKAIHSSLIEFDQNLKKMPTDEKLAAFIKAVSRATADLASRRLRHRALYFCIADAMDKNDNGD
jgi:uncharacterized protein with ParB-like and HNH nuclease domain